jgi:hypothetical protein
VKRNAEAALVLMTSLSFFACGDDGTETGSGGGSSTSAAEGSSAATTGAATNASSGAGDGGNPGSGGDAASSGSGGTTGSGGDGSGGGATSGSGGSGGGASVRACGDSATIPNPWIAEAFADVPELTGDFDSRQYVELPRIIRDATATNAKYAFDLRDDEEPVDPVAAFVNVTVTDLVSPDEYGGAVQTANAPGVSLHVSNVYLEPGWPEWDDYDTTNYDGMVLDGSAAIYAEDLTIQGWADAALDIKSERAELVCLRTGGGGHRALRFWEPGPHYVVASTIDNDLGSLVWFEDCSGATLYVYGSTFDGEPTIPEGEIECDNGEDPEIVYLDVDPRTTGEMHPMFGAP